MKTFFSVIYLTLNANLNEKVSVGLIMSNGDKTIINVSQPKLNILKNLITSSKFIFLKNYFKNIISDVDLVTNEFELDLNENFSKKWINESYFNYLSRYSNNLVNFSIPKPIDLELNLESFNKLFDKYIFEIEKEVFLIKDKDISDIVKYNLYEKIQDKVNLNVSITPNDFSELMIPVDINFIGKNGVIVSGQTIDFGKRHYNLENDLTKYISFTKAVDYSKKGKYFVIGQEPNKKESPQNHKTWKYVKQSHLVEYVDVSETDLIKEYIKSKGVNPYFEKDTK